MRVLVVEDEQVMAHSLRRGLERDGFTVDVATTGRAGLGLARARAYDAIVLDVMLPGLDGIRLCAALRAGGDWTPIVMLTARDGDRDVAEGLDNGADDYLTKPVAHAVLVARLRAVIRRGGRARPTVLSAGDLHLDPAARRCWRGDHDVALTPRELSVLEFLLRRVGQAVSKREVLDHVWDDEFEGDPNIVEVYVRYLRRKVDMPFGRAAIETVRGWGYRLAADGG